MLTVRESEREERESKRVTEVLDSNILSTVQGHFKMMMVMMREREEKGLSERAWD